MLDEHMFARSLIVEIEALAFMLSIEVVNLAISNHVV